MIEELDLVQPQEGLEEGFGVTVLVQFVADVLRACRREWSWREMCLWKESLSGMLLNELENDLRDIRISSSLTRPSNGGLPIPSTGKFHMNTILG